MKVKSSKAQLFLMEFILVILFFAICTGICISIFMYSRNISTESQDLNNSYIIAQSIAEEIKSECSYNDTVRKYSAEILSEYKNKYGADIKIKTEDNMLKANISIFKEKKKQKICVIEIKKYIPEGDFNER